MTWPPLLALLLGSERADRPDDLLTGAALPVSIPMTGTAQSLNLAVAVGVLLHKMRRRTRPAQR